MNRIRVLIADDHTLVRAGIRSLLADHADIEVIGEAASGADAVDMSIRLHPDVVLMDITMRDMSGLEATEEIRQRSPSVNVLALTMQDREEYFFAMVKAGALGYVLKGSEPDELIRAIRAVHQGSAYLSPPVTKALLRGYLTQRSGESPSRYSRLTLREREVLTLAVEGKTTREMADLLHLSAKTIEKHRASLMRKLELSNLVELTKYAIRKGLIETGS